MGKKMKFIQNVNPQKVMLIDKRKKIGIFFFFFFFDENMKKTKQSECQKKNAMR